MHFSEVNGFIIGLNARVHRKVLNVSNFLLNATKTSQRRPHFHKELSRLRRKKKSNHCRLCFCQSSALSQGKEDFEAEDRGLWGRSAERQAKRQGEPKLLTEYSYAKT